MSNQEAMQQLTDRFMNDADFREEMRKDPEGTAERSGFALDEEDRQALRSVDWSGTDEELNERVSKRIRYCWAEHRHKHASGRPTRAGVCRPRSSLILVNRVALLRHASLVATGQWHPAPTVVWRLSAAGGRRGLSRSRTSGRSP